MDAIVALNSISAALAIPPVPSPIKLSRMVKQSRRTSVAIRSAENELVLNGELEVALNIAGVRLRVGGKEGNSSSALSVALGKTNLKLLRTNREVEVHCSLQHVIAEIDGYLIVYYFCIVVLTIFFSESKWYTLASLVL